MTLVTRRSKKPSVLVATCREQANTQPLKTCTIQKQVSVPRIFFSDSFESSIVMAPLLESKLTTIPSCKRKQNVNYQGGDVYCNSELQLKHGVPIRFQIGHTQWRQARENGTQAKLLGSWLVTKHILRFYDWSSHRIMKSHLSPQFKYMIFHQSINQSIKNFISSRILE